MQEPLPTKERTDWVIWEWGVKERVRRGCPWPCLMMTVCWQRMQPPSVNGMKTDKLTQPNRRRSPKPFKQNGHDRINSTTPTSFKEIYETTKVTLIRHHSRLNRKLTTLTSDYRPPAFGADNTAAAFLGSIRPLHRDRRAITATKTRFPGFMGWAHLFSVLSFDDEERNREDVIMHWSLFGSEWNGTQWKVV